MAEKGPPKVQFASYWLGESLGAIERLCLQRLVNLGHDVTLFIETRIANVPNGVDQRRASDIWDAEYIILHQRTGSPAPHADLFRLKLIKKTDFIWVDLDLYFYKPLAEFKNYVIAYEDQKSILVGNSILRLPKNSPALFNAIAFIESYTRTQTYYSMSASEMEQKFGINKPARGFEMYIGSFGPHLLTSTLKHSHEIKFAENNERFFPIYISNVRALVRRPAIVMGQLGAENIAIHLWASRLRRVIAKSPFHQIKNSYIGKLCSQNGIDPIELVSNTPHAQNLAQIAKENDHG